MPVVVDNPNWAVQGNGWGGYELLQFDVYDPGPAEQTMQRLDILEEPVWVTYNVAVQRIDNDVHIAYEEEQNQDMLDEHGLNGDDFYWGIHILHNVVPGQHGGASTWFDAPGPGWTLLQPDGGEHDRPLAAIHAIQRGEQGEFRQHLLGLDRCCAISGENCENALEAAHVLPAHLGGREVLSNGILLRADLHRLYDAHPPRFHICPDTGHVQVAEGFLYEGLDLGGCQIDDNIRRRIRDALILRQNELHA